MPSVRKGAMHFPEKNKAYVEAFLKFVNWNLKFVNAKGVFLEEPTGCC